MATLSVESIDEDGLNPTFNAMAAGGDVADNSSGEVFLYLKNTSTGAVVVTVTAQDTSASRSGYGTLTKADATVSVPAAGDRAIGPFPKTAFNNTSNQIEFAAASTTSMTCAVLRLTKAV